MRSSYKILSKQGLWKTKTTAFKLLQLLRKRHMNKLRFYTRDHRGGLKESLETTQEISETEFKTILPMYEYYAYDERVNQAIWISKNMQDRKYKTWLFIGTREGISNYLNKIEK